jgi:hypothetical protein
MRNSSVSRPKPNIAVTRGKLSSTPPEPRGNHMIATLRLSTAMLCLSVLD